MRRVAVALVVLAVAGGGVALSWQRDSKTVSSARDFSVEDVPSLLECPGASRVLQFRQSPNLNTAQPTPDASFSFSAMNLGWASSTRGFRLMEQTSEWAVFTFTNDGRVVAAAGTGRTSNGWVMKWGGNCAPEDLPIDLAETLAYHMWRDAKNQAVSPDAVSSSPGPEHCAWESATFLYVRHPDGQAPATQYVRDPDGVLGNVGVEQFDANASLPASAVDTGWHRGNQELWLTPSQDAAYLVNTYDPSDVERWPRPETQIGCA